ncbi:sodium:solute symporter [candidate division KSB1 bacterium]|nr:sodium:solute symporter [candidate division KSB1 bacterium]
MQSLGLWDYAIFLAYFSVLITLGLILRKKASGSLESYFLANNRLPWWMLGVTGMGWSLDVTGTMLIISLLYLIGPRGLFIEFRGGANLSLIFMMLWTGKWHRRSGLMTGAEWMTFRFGDGLSGRFARASFAVSQIIFAIGMLAYMVKGVGLFACMFIPLSPFQCALIVIGVATIYTVASGFYGVVFSDLLQCTLIIIGIVYISITAYNQISDGAEFANLATSISGVREWTTAFPQKLADMPAGYEIYETLLIFTMFLILKNIVSGFGSGFEPHYFAARNERECGKLTALWATLMSSRWFMMAGFAVLGIFMVHSLFDNLDVLSQAAALVKDYAPAVQKSQWPALLASIINQPAQHPAELVEGLKSLLGENWLLKMQLLSYEGTVNAERILPAVLLSIVPAGIRGLILVTLIAATMSTFDMTLNRTSAFFVRDIYQKFWRPNASNKEVLAAIYAFTVSLVGLAFYMGYSSQSINDIWGWIMMGLWSGLSVPLVLRLYWWRFNGSGFAAGMVVGVLAAVLQRAFWPSLPEQWQFVGLTLISLVAAIIGTFASAPTDRNILENFYRITRPFGFWKPLRPILDDSTVKTMKKEHRNDLLALPFAFIWIVSMFLIPILFIMHQKSIWHALIVFLISLAGLYKFWYKNLPPAE